MTPRNDWVARIVELRADSPFKVFALVAWLYWPEDLYTAWSKGETKAKNGKKGYHGDYELIASNHLDIMDVHSFDNNFNHLIEQDYEDHEGDGELKECYYRQMYDYRTGKLTVSTHSAIVQTHIQPHNRNSSATASVASSTSQTSLLSSAPMLSAAFGTTRHASSTMSFPRSGSNFGGQIQA